jgi:hypothetical protein
MSFFSFLYLFLLLSIFKQNNRGISIPISLKATRVRLTYEVGLFLPVNFPGYEVSPDFTQFFSYFFFCNCFLFNRCLEFELTIFLERIIFDYQFIIDSSNLSIQNVMLFLLFFLFFLNIFFYFPSFHL